MIDDFSQCLVSNSRMAARAITRRYDLYLRPYGISSTQLSLLGGLGSGSERTVSDLADARGFDRTTLTRNLDRLEAMGLIASRPAPKGNGRLCELTAKGHNLLVEVSPLWREAQAEMRSLLSDEGFEASIRTLQRLAEV